MDERGPVLKALRSVFGPSVLRRTDVFEVNQKYFMEVSFDFRGRVSELAVLPKYQIQKELWNDEWTKATNPYSLTLAEFKEILAKLEVVKPIGKLQETQGGLVPTSGITEYADRYEHAVLLHTTYSPWDYEKGESAGPDRVRRLSVLYFRTVAGIVQKTEVEDLKGLGFKRYRARIDGHWHYVTECDFKKLKTNKRGSFVTPSWPFYGFPAKPCD